MNFADRTIRSGEIREIAAFYGMAEPLDTEYLGGIPNVTYRVASTDLALATRICNSGYASPERLRCELAGPVRRAACGGGAGRLPVDWRPPRTGGGRHRRYPRQRSEAFCASGLEANALHEVAYAESRSLIERLDLLADQDGRPALVARLNELWRRAETEDPPNGTWLAAHSTDRSPNPDRSTV
ncbi:hypothetical protein ACQEVC_20010 [Plantactinospora sp. CA-294935]|uniref:hypothetical protein n=1 Tax=Plantactinospora sp. CA-294935 TaxID=3240012 RepID=UPI003D8AB47E